MGVLGKLPCPGGEGTVHSKVLECHGFAGALASVAQGDDNVPDKEEGCEAKADRADCGDLIQGLELPQVLVNERIGDAAHHSPKTEIVHREECQVEKDESQEELNLAYFLVEHPAKHLREPEIKGTEERHDASAKEYVMDVSDDEVGVMDEQVHRR